MYNGVYLYHKEQESNTKKEKVNKMTFTEFEVIVKNKYPQAEVFKHGEFVGNKINVAVIFTPQSKVYKYNGTYCEVLNKLGFKAIYKHNLEAVKNALAKAKAEHGTQDEFFGLEIDNTEDITRLEADLKEYESYIVV